MMTDKELDKFLQKRYPNAYKKYQDKNEKRGYISLKKTSQWRKNTFSEEIICQT